MRLPIIRGIIGRRILVNYRIDATIAAGLLPPPFRPKLIRGFAVAGICLIRLRQIRPAWLPAQFGIGSENAAHRFAVEWEADGVIREGVYIPRRDSSSYLNSLLGGRLVPGEHHHAWFVVAETAERLHVEYASGDGGTRVSVDAAVSDDLTPGSMFESVQVASEFFRRGEMGYSATRDAGRFDGLALRCDVWALQPLRVDRVQSSFFDDLTVFPAGSATLDCALLMRGLEHQWHSLDDIQCCGIPAGA